MTDRSVNNSLVNDGTQLPGLTIGAQLGKPPGVVDRQPTNVNYLYQTYFRFNIHRLPKMEYFIQRVNLPGFGSDQALEQPTRFVAAKHPTARPRFDNLTMTFLVNESMENWREIYDWMKTIYLVKDHDDYNEKISNHLGLFNEVKGSSEINNLKSNTFVTKSVAPAKSVKSWFEPLDFVSRYMVKEPLITLAPVNEPIGLSTTPIVSGVTYVTLFAIVIDPPVILIS